MVTVHSPDTIRRLLKKLEAQRDQLSIKIAEEDKKIKETMALRRMFPADRDYKTWYEQHVAKCDRYQRQYVEVTRVAFSLKLQLHGK